MLFASGLPDVSGANPSVATVARFPVAAALRSPEGRGSALAVLPVGRAGSRSRQAVGSAHEELRRPPGGSTPVMPRFPVSLPSLAGCVRYLARSVPCALPTNRPCVSRCGALHSGWRLQGSRDICGSPNHSRRMRPGWFSNVAAAFQPHRSGKIFQCTIRGLFLIIQPVSPSRQAKAAPRNRVAQAESAEVIHSSPQMRWTRLENPVKERGFVRAPRWLGVQINGSVGPAAAAAAR